METFSEWTKTLSNEHRRVLDALRTFRVDRITLDMDEVMSRSQVPVIKRASIYAKLDYSQRSLERFGDVEKWLQDDIGVSAEIAAQMSWGWWTDPICLYEANPNTEIQEYSLKAAFKGVDQYVVTGRRASLRESTLDWLDSHYRWISPDKLKITENNDDLYDPYHKVSILKSLKPDVHFEDSVNDIEKILKAKLPDTYIVWFARPQEYGDLNHRNVIQVPSMGVFADYVN